MGSEAQQLAERLSQMSIEDRRDAFANAVIENGGAFNPPNATPPGRKIIVAAVHGIETTAFFVDAAIENWIEIALRRSPYNDQPLTDLRTTISGPERERKFGDLGGTILQPEPAPCYSEEALFVATLGTTSARGTTAAHAIDNWIADAGQT